MEYETANYVERGQKDQLVGDSDPPLIEDQQAKLAGGIKPNKSEGKKIEQPSAICHLPSAFQGGSLVESSKPFVRRLNALTAILTIGIGGFIGGFTAYRQFSQTRVESKPVPSVPEIKTVTTLGRLEPRDEVIQVSAPSSTEGNRVKELLVEKGDRVETGQIIAILDSHNRAAADLKEAEERVRVAQANLAQVKAGAKKGEIKAQEAEVNRVTAELEGKLVTNEAEIARLQAQLRAETAEKQATIARWQAELNNAESDFQRYQKLATDGVISDSELDSRRLKVETVQKSLAEAQASHNRILTTLKEQIKQAQAKARQDRQMLQQQIAQAESTLSSVAEVRPVDVEVAATEVREAQAAVETAQAELDLAYIKAPQAGQILDILTRPGEAVSSNGIARIGQTSQMYAVAEVYESDIGKVKVGQQATVTSNALSEELHGKVERIGLEVLRQEVINTEPAANIDAKIVEVKVRLDRESSQKVEGLTNLLVKVAIAL